MSSAAVATQSASAPQFKKVPQETLHVSKPTSWLESRFHFSFADHWDPKRMSFGKLRVVNDDLVKPMEGFDTHPHRDMEIFSYIVDGYLTHQDSKGNKETLGRGAVQYMSAGTGVYHSEMNNHRSETCRFLQVWVQPNARGLAVQYGSTSPPPAEQRHNRIRHIISGSDSAETAPIKLNQDCNVYIGELDAGASASLPLAAGRQAYMVCIEGKVSLAGGKLELSARDAAQLFGGTKGSTLDFTAGEGKEGAHFMVIELAGSENAQEL
ncbi:RmlC-like cupin [Tribonema minus]|uniref:RmlC-like cupin n=1 Tax=Tribonema minus TaxID=303371 RepID=A0A835YRX5_9STRA|nr:RmlC-like cupin [Tribonema minus]